MKIKEIPTALFVIKVQLVSRVYENLNTETLHYIIETNFKFEVCRCEEHVLLTLRTINIIVSSVVPWPGTGSLGSPQPLYAPYDRQRVSQHGK